MYISLPSPTLTSCYKLRKIEKLGWGGYFFSVSNALSQEKAMATYSSTLAWKIPWMEEPGGLPSMGLHRVRHD